MTYQDRLREYYRRLQEQSPSQSPEEALERLRGTLDEVEDLYSGVPKKDPPPPPGQSDGRMYPPLDDFIKRQPDGGIAAQSRGHRIECGPDGNIRITNRKTGRVEFEQPGSGTSHESP